ncbi:MAG: 4a-hydroxytetrahydrobiopterin dehydratase [Chromatiales bacterium]|jgi:pterin-4a-carbinolamine dehydratase
MAQEWQERNRPARLERRYEFANYDDLRDFLDMAADLSEQKGLYPNIGFGRGYANFTIYPEEGDVISDSEREFAMKLEEISHGGNELQA